MNDYDQASRYAAKLNAPGFLRWLLGGQTPLRFREWYDTANAPLPGGEDRTSDTIALMDNTEDPEEPFALAVEFETENDVEIMERELEYLAIIRRRLRRQSFKVVGALVNLTGTEQNSSLEMLLPGQPDVGIRLALKLRTLRNEEAGALVDAISAGRQARCLLPWIPLMRDGGEPAIIERWKEIAGAEPDAKMRSDYGVLAKTFARLKDYADVWLQALKEWNVIESPYLNEERLQVQREDLRSVIEARFQAPCPPELVSAIEHSTDRAELRRWLVAVVSAPTLEAYRAAIGR